MIGGADDIERPLQQRRHRHSGVGGDRHKGGVGAILQQAPHQIRQEVAMAADRRIGPIGGVGMILVQLRIKRVAHAMQSLKLEAVAVADEFQNGGNRQRVVGGELRKKPRPQLQERFGAGDVVQVGHRLAREDRIAVEAALLRALDLAVPIGALDQPHHHTAIEALRQLIDVIDHGARAFLVGLDGKTEAIPARQLGIAECRRDHIQRQFQPVGFLGINGEIQIVGFCLAREFDQPRHQFRHHAALAHCFETRMQRRQLYRNAGSVGQRTIIGRTADGVDRGGVRSEIALRVRGGARAFAEHVEGIARPAGRMRPLQCGFDGFAEHEVASHQSHRLPCRRANRRQAQAFRQPPDRALRGLAGLNHPGRQAKRPGRGVDQEGAGFGLVVDEVTLPEPVLDELIGGRRIRHPQQRLGQHHQRQSLLGG